MNATATFMSPGPAGLLRHSRWDAVLVGLAFAHGLLLWFAPSIALIGIGLWWNTNTIGHNFIHLPFFRPRLLNHLFGAYLSVVTGVPQRLWRERHLAHHRDARWRPGWSVELAIQSLLVLGTWCVILALAPGFFVFVYVPGYALGLLLCRLHGHYEHARGTVSHYGQVYNRLFFNDGFHVEHHARPGRHWTRLRTDGPSTSKSSRWPAVLRWLEGHPLYALERLVLRSGFLQCFVLRSHERAWRAILRTMPRPDSVMIVGGGLFPRSALVLKKLLPDARLLIVDAVPAHIDCARRWLNGSADYKVAFYSLACAHKMADRADLVVFPLSFKGERESIYRQPPAAATVVHDWIWRRRGRTAVVSWLLLKRLNMVCR